MIFLFFLDSRPDKGNESGLFIGRGTDLYIDVKNPSKRYPSAFSSLSDRSFSNLGFSYVIPSSVPFMSQEAVCLLAGSPSQVDSPFFFLICSCVVGCKGCLFVCREKGSQDSHAQHALRSYQRLPQSPEYRVLSSHQ